MKIFVLSILTIAMIGLIIPGVFAADIGGPTLLKIEIEVEGNDVTINGRLTDETGKFAARNAEIELTLLKDGTGEKSTYTNNMGWFKEEPEIFPDGNYKIHAVFNGNSECDCWEPSKTVSVSFTTPSESTQTKSDTQTTKSPFIFPNLFEQTEIIFAVIIIGAIIGIIIAVKKHNGKKNKSDGDDKYKNYFCKHCSKIFNSEKECDKHQKTHEKVPLQECERCGKSFSTDLDLIAHMPTCGDDPPPPKYPCTRCREVFSYEKDLVEHTLTVHKVKQFICNVCKNTFESEKDLKRHKKIHEPDDDEQILPVEKITPEHIRKNADNPYAVFGLSRKSSKQEIRTRFRELSKKSHSDKGGSDDLQVIINKTYEKLKESHRGGS